MIGTVGIPNILLGILIALPFIDLRRERRLSRRPVAIVDGDHRRARDGDADVQGRDREGGARLRDDRGGAGVGREAGLRGQQRGDRGRGALRRLGLPPVSHLPRHRRSANLGAPDLTAIGATNKGAEYFQRYVTNPAEFGNTAMQPYAGLGEENLQKIAAFLDASKGPKE